MGSGRTAMAAGHAQWRDGPYDQMKLVPLDACVGVAASDSCGIRTHAGRPHGLSRPTPWPLGQSVLGVRKLDEVSQAVEAGCPIFGGQLSPREVTCSEPVIVAPRQAMLAPGKERMVSGSSASGRNPCATTTWTSCAMKPAPADAGADGVASDTCGIRTHAGRPHRLSRPTPWPLGQSVVGARESTKRFKRSNLCLPHEVDS